MIKKFCRILFIFVLIWSFFSISYAQRQTGSLQGIVVDEKDNALPGANVTVLGPGLQGSKSYTTSNKGLFRFPALPPGSYTLQVELSGFQSQNITGLTVSIAKVTEITIRLKPSTLEEQITVIAAAPVVDTTSSTLTLNYSSEFLASIPMNRDIYDVINSAPGAISDENPNKRTSSVMGADIRQTQYSLDGVNITDPSASYLTASMNVEMFEEVSFEVGSHMPESGQTDSGFINIVTKSGGNKFSGSVSAYYIGDSISNPLWTEEQTAAFGLDQVDRYKNYWDLAGTFGGPIIKDRLWFFASYQYVDWLRFFSPYDYNLEHTENILFGKLTAQLTPNLRLMGSFHYNTYDEPIRVVSARWGRLKGDVPYEMGNHTDILNLQANWIIDQNTFLDLKFGHNFRLLPLHAQPGTENEPKMYDKATATSFNSITYEENYRTHKYVATASLTRFQEDFLGGDHEIKLGFEFEHVQYELDYWKQNPFYLYWYDYEAGNPYYYSPSKKEGRLRTYPTPRGPGEWAAKDYGLRYSAYFQDSVNLKRLVLNFGLRYDDQEQYEPEQSRPYVGNPLFDAIAEYYLIPEGLLSPWAAINQPRRTMVHFKNLSPRIGLVFDVFGNGKTAAKVSYSRYYEPVWMYKYNYGNILQQADVQFRWIDLNGNKQFDPPPTDSYSLFDYPNQDINFHYYPDNLKNMHTDEFIIGLDHELLKDLKLGISYIMKRNRDIVEDIDINNGYDPSNPNWIPYTFTDPGWDGEFGTPDDKEFTVYGLSEDAPLKVLMSGNPEGAKRNYDALAFTVEKRMSNNWQLKGSILYSSYKGNIGAGYDDTDGDTGAFDTPNWLINNYGSLWYDRPLQVKLLGTFILPYDFIFSFYFTHISGKPWNRTLDRVYFPSGYNVQESYVGINAEKPGSQREPGYTNLDLRLQKDINPGYGRLSLYLDIFNVGGRSSLDINQDPAGRLYYYKTPPQYTLSTVYGKITSVTGVRAVRLGIKYAF